MDAPAPAVVAVPGVRRPARLLRFASDERLVALVRAGDEGAFEAVYDRHHRPILSFCRHMLGSREEAEDAVQQTFLSAYRNLCASDKPIQLRPWLFAIARNRCLSLLRARREHASIDDAEPSTEGLTATVERREDLRELLGDVARLPEDQRAALLLAEVGALDHADIATVLGCPREKVKALVFQARSSLAASRDARATPCEEIRLELATASGGALRRGPLRRHLSACAGCRAFKAEIATQRKLLALALPVVIPGVALKAAVLSGISGGSGAVSGGAAATAAGSTATGVRAIATGGGGATAAGVASGAAWGSLSGLVGTVVSTGAAKVAVSLAVAGAVAGGGAITLDGQRDGSERPAGGVPAQTTPAALPASARGAPSTGANGTRVAPGASTVAGMTPPRDARARGFVPLRGLGPGNGPAARERAHDRADEIAPPAQGNGSNPPADAGPPASLPAKPPKATRPGTPQSGGPQGAGPPTAPGSHSRGHGSPPTAPGGHSRGHGSPPTTPGSPSRGHGSPPATTPALPPSAQRPPSAGPPTSLPATPAPRAGGKPDATGRAPAADAAPPAPPAAHGPKSTKD